MDPAATYDAYGSSIEAAGAVPAHAVVAEPDVYLSRNLTVEGMTTDDCDIPECWTSLDAGNDDRIQVIIAQRDDGSHAFDVPSDVVGRRIIAAGNLRRGSIDETRDSTYSLLATGVLIEKVRP